jgi:hypothetical protein
MKRKVVCLYVLGILIKTSKSGVLILCFETRLESVAPNHKSRQDQIVNSVAVRTKFCTLFDEEYGLAVFI